VNSRPASAATSTWPIDSGSYTTNSTDYILFVHGWRMKPWERRAFAHTAFKRLWWQGYRGRFGLFSWPTDWVNDPLFLQLLDAQNYDRSERRAWRSAYALRRLLQDLGGRYPGRVRMMAHSMGNVTASEALRRQGLRSATALLHTYVASQASTVAHAYDATGPETIETDASTDTPETYAHYPTNNLPYFIGMTNAVQRNIGNGSPRIVNFHNRLDYALNKWLINQDAKPDSGWVYSKPNQGWFRVDTRVRLHFPHDTYEIYAHMAEARSRALGAAVDVNHTVGGQIGSSINLGPNTAFDYQGNDWEHSAEFLSTIMRRRSYWSQLLTTFQISP
jgi:hypothetical protein